MAHFSERGVSRKAHFRELLWETFTYRAVPGNRRSWGRPVLRKSPDPRPGTGVAGDAADLIREGALVMGARGGVLPAESVLASGVRISAFGTVGWRMAVLSDERFG
jgi:hypothetical protein